MRLAPSLRHAIYAAMALLFASGAAWLLTRYVFTAGKLPDGFAANAMALHGAAATAMLVLTGSAVALHAPGAWRERRNRPSGVALSATLLVIAVTGCFLYYLGDESARAAGSAAHWILGLAVPVVFVWHVWRGRQGQPLEKA